MAGMIEEIFGVQPREVRLAQRAEQQKEIDANIAEETTVLGKLGAGIGTGIGQGLTEGLRERLGIKTDAEKIAESSKAEAQELVQAMSQATKPADFEAIKLALIARGADPKYVTMFETMRKDALERQKPVVPQQVSAQDIENAGNVISLTMEKLGLPTDFQGSYDKDAYTVNLMEKVNQEKAKLLTSQKQGNQTPLPTDSQLVSFFIREDVKKGIIRSDGDFFGDTELIYTPPQIVVTDYQDQTTGEIYEVTKK